MASSLPDRADAVVIGGGIIGLATAYHLCHRGLTDVVVLERCQIASGTTWHAAGLIGSVRPSENFHQLIDRVYDFIRAVEEESDQPAGFRQVGSIWIAEEAERWAEIRRLHDQTRLWGPETRLVTPAEIASLYPLMNIEGLVGGMFAPGEGWISPVDFCRAVAGAATRRGARIIENTPVTGIDLDQGRIAAVRAGGQRIETARLAVCAGLWGRHIGLMAGADIPLQAVEHYYAVTEKSDRIPRDLPVLREQNAGAYIKEDAGALLVGAFERKARPVALSSLPDDFAFSEIDGDIEGQFLPVLEAATRRLPILEELGIRILFCGPESFTPDGAVQIGAIRETPGLYACCGCNSQGIQSAAGYGSALADWMVDDRPPFDLSNVDIMRNERFVNAPDVVWKRSAETLGLLYDHHYPYRQLATARGIRRGPLHDQLARRGACFGEVAGWERANWFAPAGVEPVYEYSFGRQNWFPHSAAEHMAFREGVGIIDLSSFAALQVAGPDAMAELQRISAANVDVPPGRIVYTHWLNESAGIESDLTVARLGPELFQVTTGVAVRRRDWNWLHRNLHPGARVHTTDLSSGTAIIGVFGPRSRAMLEAATGTELSNRACPFGHSLPVTVGAAPALAVRMSFAGGLGWELHLDAEFAAHAFETLVAAGESFDARLCGMHALDSCRIERGFVHYGHEVSQDETPFHVGLGFVCDFTKSAFIGSEAALRIKEAGVAKLPRRMVNVLLEDPEPLLFGHEPILRDGAPVGYVASGAYGHALGAAVGLGWLRNEAGVSRDWIEAGRYEVLVESSPTPARVSLRPFFDPDGTIGRS